MAVSIPVPTQDISTQPAVVPKAVTTSVDERWAAWLARGTPHDREVLWNIALPRTFTARLMISAAAIAARA
jgi:ABC-type Fe3+-siderophore transport system permease subunit